MKLQTGFMRAYVSLLIITFMISTSSQAKSDVFVKQLQKGTSTYYVLCLEDGTELHEPIPYPIDDAPFEGGFDGCDIFAYYDPITDNESFAIYFESTGFFSGFIYREVHDFSEGLAAACSLVNGKFGYIDRNGNVIVPFQWEWAEDFENGIAMVTYQTFDDYKNVWINKTGEIISIDPEWGYAIQNLEAE